MEKELSKLKMIIVAVFGIIFIGMAALFIAASAGKNRGAMPDQQSDATSMQQEGAQEEKAVVEDKIDFEDPGNDETGQSIKELDSLVNDISPSELSGDDLSEDLIEGDIQSE